MVCDPAEGNAKERVASLLPSTAEGGPIATPLSKNCTLPVGVCSGPFVVSGPTNAMRMTDSPAALGLGVLERVTKLSRTIDWVSVALVGAKFSSPL